MFRLLYDLTATQPTPDSKFHGAGTYAEIVFLKLVSQYDAETVSVCAAWDSDRYINQELVKAAAAYNVPLYDIRKVNPADIFEQYHINRCYSALLDESIPWPLDKAAFITTVHGLRSLEMPMDKIALQYETSFKGALKTFAKLYIAPHRYFRKVYNGYSRFFQGNMKIITVSRHSKASILSFFPKTDPTSVSVYSSPSFDQLDGYVAAQTDFGQISGKWNIQDEKYFLITSAGRWIKNALRAVYAFDSLFDNEQAVNYSVVITGITDKTVFTRKLHHPERFRLLGFVDRDELETLHKHAYAFVYPSLNEGFGYPPMEAMKYGVPVAASGTSSIPEVCGDAALYFDPYSIAEIKNRIIQLLEPEIRNRYAALAVKQYKIVSAMQKQDLTILVQKLLAPDFKKGK